MKFKTAFIRSKVARRVVWLFVLSSLLPVVAIAFFSFTYISDLLIKQSYKELQHSSKLYGMAVMDRLTYVDNEMRELTNRLKSKSFTEMDNRLKAYGQRQISQMHTTNIKQIDRLYLQFVPEASLGPARFDSSGGSKSYIYAHRNREGVTNVYLRQVLGRGHGDTMATLVAKLNNAYVWGAKNRLPFSTFLCVIENNTEQVLFCPYPHYQPLLDKIKKLQGLTDSRKIAWHNAEGENLAAAWDLFISSRFSGNGWKIISSKKKTAALLPVYAYQKIFPLVIGFSLLVVLLLSMIQVRRIMLPLELLVAATRRLAKYQFGVSVKVNSKDEFNELSDSFNAMAYRLEKQLNALKILSDIDRLILSCPDPEVVLASILDTAYKIITCDYIAVYFLDKEDAGKASVYIKNVVTNSPARLERINIPELELAEISSEQDVRLLELSQYSGQMFAPLLGKNIACMQLRSIRLDNEARVVFCLCYRSAETMDSENNAIVSDIIDRLAVTLATADRDEKLYRQAHFDYLTGLPNRQLFNDRLEQHIIQARRKKEKIAVLYVDLDRFKNINDSLGHTSGDNLLRQVADRMRYCVRETDTVSRLGGDEFVVLLSNISSHNDASLIAENVISAVNRQFFINTREIFITTSIGIAVYPDDGLNNKELMAHADAAMYHAKESGQGSYKYFEESMNLELVQRIEMETALRYALEREEFQLYYQPQISLQTGEVISIEALIRWEHPQMGILLPGEFIPLAEESGLIEPIGEWVLRAACKQFQQWRKKCVEPLRLAVNISSRQFMRENFVGLVDEVINETGIMPEELELEITESLLLNENLKTRRIFDKLAQIGVQLAIDDFGTGYSSLSYLKRFAVHTLKIDRAFTMDIPEDEQATTLTLSIIAMAHALGMQVVAEGVENAAQVALLSEHQCDCVQGNYFSHPLPTDDISAYLMQGVVDFIPHSLLSKR
ncbi:MAG: EAL domain-containing protein [Gammaproteobacteria bacterium]